MEISRKNIFETNSSSTHRLVVSKRKYKLPKRHFKKNWKGTVMPVNYDVPNVRVEIRNFYDNMKGKGENKDLNHVDYMASYLFTALMNLRERLIHKAEWRDKELTKKEG